MRFLILTAAFGTGHNRVAEALEEAFVREGHAAEVCDVLSTAVPVANSLLTKGFLYILATAPGLYGLAYNQTELQHN